MNPLTFSRLERVLSFIAGLTNMTVGVIFFFLPELNLFLWKHNLPLWSVFAVVQPLLARFIGAIIIGNGVGAFWLSTECEWARVRPLALVAVAYGALVALALFYHLLWLKAESAFWIYFWVDFLFTLVYCVLFFYHDIAPLLKNRQSRQQEKISQRLETTS